MESKSEEISKKKSEPSKKSARDEIREEEAHIFRIWLKILDKAFKHTEDGHTPLYTRPGIAESRIKVYRLLRGVAKLTEREEKDEFLALLEVETCESLNVFSRRIYEVYKNVDSKLTKDDSFKELMQLRRKSFRCRCEEGFREIIKQGSESLSRFNKKKVAIEFDKEKEQICR